MVAVFGKSCWLSKLVVKVHAKMMWLEIVYIVGFPTPFECGTVGPCVSKLIYCSHQLKGNFGKDIKIMLI